MGLPYRILNINYRKELLRGLWVGFRGLGLRIGVQGLALLDRLGRSKNSSLRVSRNFIMAHNLYQGFAQVVEKTR